MGVVAPPFRARQRKGALWGRAGPALVALLASVVVGGAIARGGLWLLPVLMVAVCIPFAALRLEVALAFLLVVAAVFYYLLQMSSAYMREALGGTFTPWDFAVAVMLARCWRSVASPPRGARERRLFLAVALWGALAIMAMIVGLVVGHKAALWASRRYFVIPVFFIALGATRTARQTGTVWSVFLLAVSPLLVLSLYQSLGALGHAGVLVRALSLLRGEIRATLALLALHLPAVAAPWLRRHAKRLGAALFLLAAASTIVSGTRNAIAALAVFSGLSCFGRDRDVTFRRVCTVLAAVGIAIAWTSVGEFGAPIRQRWGREYAIRGTPTAYRLQESAILWELGRGQLAWGRGVGAPHATPALPRGDPRWFAEQVPWTHNLYLETLFVGGWLLLAALVAMLVCGFMVARAAATRGVSSSDRTTGRIAIIMLLVSAVGATVAGWIRSPDTGAILMTMLAAATNAVSTTRTAVSGQKARQRPV